MSLYALAERLHMPVGVMMREMTLVELAGWVAYLEARERGH